MAPDAYVFGEVKITAKKARENIERPTMGVIDVPVVSVRELPAIMGEKDLFRILQLLPGVQSGSEASAGFYVRGGGPDQNLVTLDEAVLYNPFHLGGYLSTFNGDAIKSVSLIKGGFPAQYGGRLSSIIDISMKDGNNKEYHGEGGVGAVASRLTLEGPIVKDKSSFMISGRRTYFDLLVRPFLPKGIDGGYYFYDLNTKINYRFSDKDRVYASSYMGKDIFFEQYKDRSTLQRSQIDWGNKMAALRWNHLYSDKLFSNVTLLYNDYQFEVKSILDDNIRDTVSPDKATFTSSIRDWGGKADFEYFPTIRHKIRTGVAYTYQTFTPAAIKGEVADFQTFVQEQVKFVHQGAAYISDEFVWTDKISINMGLRAPFFIYKTTHYFPKTIVEPRLTAMYSIDRNSSIKASYTLMDQYIHLLSSSTVTLPMDLWIPSSDVVKPQIANQYSAGYFRNFKDDRYETSVEVYYKDMRNMIEYKEGADILLNQHIDDELVFGRGWSYGAEFFARKNEGRLTGWIGYTLAWANRKFPDLNAGKTYPAKYDRRNDLSITGVYNFNKKWSFSAIFVYGSGHSLTLPFGSYNVPIGGWNGGVIEAQDYVQKNYYKLKSYNRLDIGIKYTVGENKKWKTDWRFDIYNVYSRRNPYFVYLTESYDVNANAYKPAAKQVSLFPIIPSVSYNFRF
jgi:hypothetical protein